MIKNYIKIAFRNLKKNKVFSFINIFGLAIGLTCFLLIAGYVYNELSYDKYPVEAKNIYRVEAYVTGNGNTVVYPAVDVAVGEGIKNAYPEVKATTRFLSRSDYVKYGDKQFKEEHLAFADSNFFSFFLIPLIEGNKQTALVQPNSVVISKEFAKKYFGNKEAVGKALEFGTRGVAYKVTGVFDQIPENSHFHFDAFLSLTTFTGLQQTWSNVGFYSYILLNENADPKKLETKFPQLVAKYVVPEVQHDMGVSLAEAQKSVNTFIFKLQPLTGIHLYSNTKYELEPSGDIQYVYIFSALAIFILLLACVNFTNLSVVQAFKRAREVGIRKVLGSLKKQLMFQFLSESVLLAFFAMLCSFVLIFLLLPYFNHLANKNIGYSFFLSYQSILFILFISLLVGILAGIYPAFILSAFKTTQVLKGAGGHQGSQKKILRNGLIVFQFFVSTSLIIATIIVFQQLHYMQNKKLGYDKEQVLYLQDTQLLGLRDARKAFKEKLQKDPRIVSASIGNNLPGNMIMDGTQIFPKDKLTNENDVEIHGNMFHIDYNYIPTLKIPMKLGRNFSLDFSTDSSAVIINEAAVNDLGWSRTNPIGKIIVTSGQHELRVIGVTADFHYTSLKQKIAPLMMVLDHPGAALILRIKTTDVHKLLADIKKIWDSFNQAAPFSYYFLDDNFAKLYANEQRTQQIFSSFALLAIIIASLGLFGLTAFMIEQRTKEIGIRKVLGASIKEILMLVSREFLMLVSLAILISVPVTWWAMHKWLEDFAYRIKINPLAFVLAGIVVMLIALFTLSFQAIKAARANPVKNLRTE